MLAVPPNITSKLCHKPEVAALAGCPRLSHLGQGVGERLVIHVQCEPPAVSRTSSGEAAVGRPVKVQGLLGGLNGQCWGSEIIFFGSGFGSDLSGNSRLILKKRF